MVIGRPLLVKHHVSLIASPLGFYPHRVGQPGFEDAGAKKARTAWTTGVMEPWGELGVTGGILLLLTARHCGSFCRLVLLCAAECAEMTFEIPSASGGTRAASILCPSRTALRASTYVPAVPLWSIDPCQIHLDLWGCGYFRRNPRARGERRIWQRADGHLWNGPLQDDEEEGAISNF